MSRFSDILGSKDIYINGNYMVICKGNGGREKRTLLHSDTTFRSEFPDSIDLKITNQCNIGCPFCHENSVPTGKWFDIDKTERMLSCLPKVPIEIAIGGGDIITNLSLFNSFAEWCEKWGFDIRVTVSAKSMFSKDFLRRYSTSMGISIQNLKDLDSVIDRNTFYLGGLTVYHIIVGVFPYDQLEELFKRVNRVLILGFKQFGRASGTKPKDLEEWRRIVKSEMYKGYRKVTIAFDNLALEQLQIKDAMLQGEWNRTYWGHEFSSSMYIDAVEETFAPTSTSKDRVKWSDMSLLDYFKKYHHEF